MTTTWSNQSELIFLEYYQAESILWDTRLKDYKNKIKSYEAWERISSLMDIPIDELKRKKDSLMSSYRSYKNKIYKSIKSGAGADEIYQPSWFAYNLIDSFVGDSTKNKKITEATSTPHSNEEQDCIENGETQEKEENHTEIEIDAPKNKKLHQQRDPLEVVDIVNYTLTTLNNTQKSEDDDCDLYGKLLAKKLRQLSEEKKYKLMHEIDGMFIRCQYDDAASQPVRPPSTTSESNDDILPNRTRTTSNNRPDTSLSRYSEPPMYYDHIENDHNGRVHYSTYSNGIKSKRQSTFPRKSLHHRLNFKLRTRDSIRGKHYNLRGKR